MEKKRAQHLISDVFSSPFNLEKYTGFLRELLNDVTPRGSRYSGQVLPSAYAKHISQYWRIGKYIDPEGEELDLLAVEVKSVSKLYQARTALRNFAVNRLKQFDKEAALIAFYSNEDGGEDWRFSYVRIEQEAYQDESGRVKLKEDLTPARRYSYLVGVHESAHTAASQLLPILTMDYAEPLLEDVENAFSVEKVTEEFFDQYRTLFINLSEELLKQPHFKAIKPDLRAEEVSRFSKKLLGQIVFLFFLQKKGWLGVGKTQKWGDGQRNFLRVNLKSVFDKGDSYFTDFLQHLFYEALADERKGQKDPTYYNKFECRIPFLNGGLFEAEYKWKTNPIHIPNDLFHNQERNHNGDTGTGILDVFSRYNFTIKEDEPLDREVAVDPEMLGKVFENMLEITERKSKGAFYTPREIVHYICQESLINYLDNHLNVYGETHQDIDTNQGSFFGNDSRSGQLKLTQTEEVINVPRNEIEAFVRRGHLTLQNDELVQSKGKETKDISFQLSAAIRKNASVIDVALSDVRICDPAIGSGAFPVGLLHEIVTLRQVLATHSGNKLSSYDLKRHAISKSLYGVDIDASAVDIARLRLWLSLIVDEDDYDQIEALPNLDYKIVKGDALVGYPQNWVSQISSKIDSLKNQFLKTTDNQTKTRLRAQVEQALAERKADSKRVLGANVEFDFRLYFSEVWNEKGGFDIVVGNPPYVQIQKFSGQDIQKDWEAQKYESFAKTGDLYCMFYERGFQILAKGGTLAYITSNKWMRAGYGEKLRRFFLRRTVFHQLIDFGDSPIFSEATTYTNILVIGKQTNDSKLKVWDATRSFRSSTEMNSLLSSAGEGVGVFSDESYMVLTAELASVKSRIEKLGTALGNTSTKINRGVLTGINEAFILKNTTKDELIEKHSSSSELINRIIRGRDIKKYSIELPDLWMISTFPALNTDIESYPAIKDYLETFGKKLYQTGEVIGKDSNGKTIKSRKKTGNKWFETQDQISYYPEFAKPKLLFAEIVYDSAFYYDESGIYPEATCFILTGESLKYLCALLNSELLTVAFRLFYAGGDLRGETFRYKKAFLQNLPIVEATLSVKLLLETLVDYVQLLKTGHDPLQTAYFLQIIDGIIYEMYFRDEMSQAGKEIFENVQSLRQISGAQSEEEKRAIIASEFERLYDPSSKVRTAIETLDSVNVVKTIQKAMTR